MDEDEQSVQVEGVLPRDGPQWQTRYRRSVHCPTCHCFDISDVGSTSVGIRYRCWDSCMYVDFALMASGENARPSRLERMRNRYFHKFSSFPSRYGTGYPCVGCARCLVHCPGGVEITEVIKDISAREGVRDG